MLSPEKIKLSWYSNSSRYIVRKTVMFDNDEISTMLYTETPECEIDVKTNTIYKFEIIALSDVGDLESETTIITFPQQK